MSVSQHRRISRAVDVLIMFSNTHIGRVPPDSVHSTATDRLRAELCRSGRRSDGPRRVCGRIHSAMVGDGEPLYVIDGTHQRIPPNRGIDWFSLLNEILATV